MCVLCAHAHVYLVPFSIALHFFFLPEMLSELNLELKQKSSCLLSPALGLQVPAATPGTYVGPRDPNSHPYACVPSILPIGHPSNPSSNFYRIYY